MDRKASLLAFALLVALGFRAGLLLDAPHGEHAWRDADGIGVTSRFAAEGIDLLEPRVIERQQHDGVVGMELPAVNALGALFARAGLPLFLAARLPAWLSLLGLALAGWLLGRELWGSERAARLSALALALQPLALTYSRKAMPDAPMVALLGLGVAFALRSLRTGRRIEALGGGLLLALAALLKPTGVAVGAPLLIAFWKDRRKPGVLLLGLLVALPALVGTPLWFLHARALDAAHGLTQFRLAHDWGEWRHLVLTPDWWGMTVGRLLHTWLLWPTVAWMVWRRAVVLERLRAQPQVGAWLAASLFVLLLLGSHPGQHPYYALPVLLPVALLIGGFSDGALPAEDTGMRRESFAVALFLATALFRAAPHLPPPPEGLAEEVDEAARLDPRLLSVATDPKTPVVSLARFGLQGWSLPAETLTPPRLEELRRLGAAQVVDSELGGRLPAESAASLGEPAFTGSRLRVWRLHP